MPTVLDLLCELKDKGLLKGTSRLKKAQLEQLVTNAKPPPAAAAPKAQTSKKEKKTKTHHLIFLVDETNKAHYYDDRANSNFGNYYHDGTNAYKLFSDSGNIRQIGTVKIEPSHFFKKEKPSYHLYPESHGKMNGKLVAKNVRFEYEGKPFVRWNKIQEAR